jgi:hypothetical protein
MAQAPGEVCWSRKSESRVRVVVMEVVAGLILWLPHVCLSMLLKSPSKS